MVPGAGAARPSRPLLMAETGVWAPCESPAHAASTASSTVGADLMVTDGDRVVVDKKLATALWTRTLLCITLLRTENCVATNDPSRCADSSKYQDRIA